jgi:HSP20 family protein
MNSKSLVPRRSGQTQEVARDDFFDPFVTFRREIDRMFDDFFDGWHPFTANPGSLSPPVDVEETDKELLVTAELPGLSEKDVQVDLAGDVLTIKGEKKVERESGNGHRKERCYGAFERSIQLPFEVKDGDVDAKFNNGVLSIRMSKPADLQRPTRRIEVKTS